MKQIKDKVFIDTNILIYFYSKTELDKKNILDELLNNKELVISTQVLNELSNVLSKKFNFKFNLISKILDELVKWCSIHILDVNTIKKALLISEKHKYSFFDSLILASALETNCSVIYSEDMHNQHKISKNLIIINPFKLHNIN